ncbi:hypothetical protein SKAU_G00396600 [Synaphobranchus kaupii]|uniref:Uncharacterized protein n=1 Tax=Synaphobranchus kaupii TaxID=118154 RepID=A0A9Q1IE40_SYNKA|nr:hypothetical protein SKAU_G00396600 [Synaphobranchus kaupii]
MLQGFSGPVNTTGSRRGFPAEWRQLHKMPAVEADWIRRQHPWLPSAMAAKLIRCMYVTSELLSVSRVMSATSPRQRVKVRDPAIKQPRPQQETLRQ